MRPVLILALLPLMACAAPAPTASPTASASRTATPTATGTPTADVCHLGGLTYCVLNPAVTQATIAQTICRSGWAATIRPPASYTDTLKRQQLAEFAGRHPNDPSWTLSGTELDHRMPLELGGAPRDPTNLSPEIGASPNSKDRAEDMLHRSVCNGSMTLEQAQTVLRTQWLKPWPDYAGIFPTP